MLHGIDGGNNLIKVANENGVHKMVSCLGEWRPRNLKSSFGDDIEFEYQGERGFAGTLALKESEFPREMMGDSKAHEDAKLRILIALHRFSDDYYNDIVVGQPIAQHTEDEKNKIIQMLKGKHTITVNNVERTFWIENVRVGAEGASVYFASDVEGQLVRIIDIGSGTVNLATVMDGQFIDKESYTIGFGSNSNKSSNMESMVKAIIAKTSQKWSQNDCVLVAGGSAKKSFPYLKEHFTNIEIINPRIKTKSGVELVHPVYGNAVGFYNIARMVYNV